MNKCLYCYKPLKEGQTDFHPACARKLFEMCIRDSIKLFEIGLYRTDVADDAVVGKIWQHLFECRDGVFHRHGIDDELWFELLDFVDLGEALTIVSEA